MRQNIGNATHHLDYIDDTGLKALIIGIDKSLENCIFSRQGIL